MHPDVNLVPGSSDLSIKGVQSVRQHCKNIPKVVQHISDPIPGLTRPDWYGSGSNRSAEPTIKWFFGG